MRSFLKNNRKNLVDGGDKRDGLGVKQAVHREERKAVEETDCVGGRMESSPGTHCVGEGWRAAQAPTVWGEGQRVAQGTQFPSQFVSSLDGQQRILYLSD